MATIHTAGIDIDVTDDIAMEVLLNARHHAEQGAVTTASIRDHRGVTTAFLVGAGIPIAARMSTQVGDEAFSKAGLEVQVVPKGGPSIW